MPIAGRRRILGGIAAGKQSFTSQDEEAVVDSVLCTSSKGWPALVKLFCSLVLDVRRHRASLLLSPSKGENVSMPSKKWPKDSYDDNQSRVR